MSTHFLSLLVTSLIVSFGSYFQHQKVIATITDERLVEASGLEESYSYPGFFWTHNDSGGDPTIYLIDLKGTIHKEVTLEGVKNRDWEEIVTVQKNGRSYIYIAEIGDNRAVHDYVSLICLEEPKGRGQKLKVKKEDLKIMNFRYEEGARDAEAVLYDYQTDEFVLVTKREDQPLVYSFQFQPSKEPVSIRAKGTIPKNMYTAADMNECGEILLKHYGAIYYWPESEEPAVDRIINWAPASLDYIPEPQGEAICWYGKNFYTISEKNRGKAQELLLFERVR